MCLGQTNTEIRVVFHSVQRELEAQVAVLECL
jgi:hypothetical protein